MNDLCVGDFIRFQSPYADSRQPPEAGLVIRLRYTRWSKVHPMITILTEAGKLYEVFVPYALEVICSASRR